MPRKPIVRSQEHFYHLCARSNNKEHFYLPQETVWKITSRKLGLLQKEYDLKISAFVLMNNHFHLLALSPKENIDRIMYFFMKDVTMVMQKKTGRINKIFGGRYKGCLIEDSKYLLNVYKYIYRNPIVAGLSETAEDYAFSTLANTDVPFKIDPIMPMNIAVSKIVELQWINETFKLEESESLKWGLSKSVFRYKENRNSRKLIKPNFHF
ncbi:MAG: transposase [Bdellovibrionota bacterium]